MVYILTRPVLLLVLVVVWSTNSRLSNVLYIGLVYHMYLCSCIDFISSSLFRTI